MRDGAFFPCRRCCLLDVFACCRSLLCACHGFSSFNWVSLHSTFVALPKSFLLEELHCPFMSFGFRKRGKCPQIAPFPRLRVLLARVQPIASGLQLADHVR